MQQLYVKSHNQAAVYTLKFNEIYLNVSYFAIPFDYLNAEL